MNIWLWAMVVDDGVALTVISEGDINCNVCEVESTDPADVVPRE